MKRNTTVFIICFCLLLLCCVGCMNISNPSEAATTGKNEQTTATGVTTEKEMETDLPVLTKAPNKPQDKPNSEEPTTVTTEKVTQAATPAQKPGQGEFIDWKETP